MHLTRRTQLIAFLVMSLGLIINIALISTRSREVPPQLPSATDQDEQTWLLGTAPVSGRIVTRGGAPVPAATIELHNVVGRQIRLAGQVGSDDDGLFEFDEAPIGYAALVVHAEGMARAVELIDVRRGGLEEVILQLQPGAAIEGRVVQEEDEPIAGVRVCARPRGNSAIPELQARCFESGEEGEFSIGELPIGLLAVAVDGRGITSMLRPDVVAPASSLLLRVTRRGGLEGRVRLPDGDDADEAQVMIAGSGLWPPRLVDVGPDGVFRVEDLPAGVYELEARTGQLVSPRELGVEVLPGRQVTVDLDLERGVALTGVVRDAIEGLPIAGARVEVSANLMAPAPVRAQTDEQGRFSATGLYPGMYRVSVWAEGHVPIVGRGCTVPDELELAMQREGVIEGRVVDSGGYPVMDATIEPDLLRARRRAGAEIQPQPIPPPSVSSATGVLGVFHGLENIDFDPSGPVVGSRVAPADRSALELTLPPEAVASSVQPALTTTSNASSWPVRSGRDGTFRLTALPAGTYALLARHPDYASARSRPVRVVSGETLSEVEIVLPVAYRLRGRVIDDEGFAVEGVLVNAQSDAAREGELTFTDGDGSFLFTGLSGSLTVSASREGFVPVSVIVNLSEEPREELVIEIAAASRVVNGRVFDSDGMPVSGARVQVRSATTGNVITRDTVSAEDGTFRAEGLAAANVVVTASAEGMGQATLLLEDDEEEVEIELELAGALTIQAIDPHTGDGVDGCEVECLAALGQRRRQPCQGSTAVFDGLDRGRADCVVTAPGRAATDVTVEVEPGSRPEHHSSQVRVELPLSLTVRGRVLDEEGEPVIGARISLEPIPLYRSGRTPARWVESGALGAFELDGVAVDAESTLYVEHVNSGSTSVVVGPFWANEEPELEVWLQADESPRPVRRHFGLAVAFAQRGEGIVVSHVAANSTAEAAGLRLGDVLTAVDGLELATPWAAARALRGQRGSSVVLSVERGDELVSFMIERELVLH